jgi:origin recognition complex subunit 2
VLPQFHFIYYFKHFLGFYLHVCIEKDSLVLLKLLHFQVIATIAEMFWDQTKSKRKRQPGTRSQLSQTFPSQSFDDIISFLKRQTSDDVDDQVCLLIHNIDGPALRDAESQQCLAQVSCCPQVRVVASTDHVNAPLCKFVAHI